VKKKEKERKRRKKEQKSENRWRSNIPERRDNFDATVRRVENPIEAIVDFAGDLSHQGRGFATIRYHLLTSKSCDHSWKP
jgi:hypothetical protein